MYGMSNGVDSDETLNTLLLPPPLRIQDTIRAEKIENALQCLKLDAATLRRVMGVFGEEMNKGLSEEPCSLQMENTYVPELPDGSEEGLFLALDLGGTNFRVILLELKGGDLVREDVKQYHISEALRLGSGVELFQYLAECVHNFLKSEDMEHEEIPLGFTFSFPMRHHSISSGELITWTKSFKCSGMEGVDVAALLQERLTALGLKVTVQVLLNDTTGTLVAGARLDHRVGMAVILGTGSNGCYLERASRVLHWEADHESIRDVIIDVEWGAFGDNGCLSFLRTHFDDEVDSISLLATSFTFEKYIGGKYLGDVLRAVLADLARNGLFPKEPPSGSLLTAHVSLFEEECLKCITDETKSILNSSCDAEMNDEDAKVAQHVARVISNRAAQLVSVCIATLLLRMSRQHVTIAVDGSVYKRHPRIRGLMQRYVALLAPGLSFTFLQADDGSGKGSALTAAIAARLATRGS